MKKLMTLICALFCMAQVYAANPVKQWGTVAGKRCAALRPEW